MEELLEKIDNLKTSLNNEEVIIRINKLNKEVEKEKDLLNLINEYKLNNKESIKKEIYNNELFKKYKESETDLNLLIMSINTKLKEINKGRKCQ